MACDGGLAWLYKILYRFFCLPVRKIIILWFEELTSIMINDALYGLRITHITVIIISVYHIVIVIIVRWWFFLPFDFFEYFQLDWKAEEHDLKKICLIEGEVTISWHDMHSNSVVVSFLYSCSSTRQLVEIPTMCTYHTLMMNYRRCQVNSLFFHWLWRCW